MKQISLLSEPAFSLAEKLKKKQGRFKKLYSLKEWKQLRVTLLKENPYCVWCLSVGRLRIAKVIDHITAHEGNLKLFLDFSNLQGLCKECHGIKSAREKHGTE